MTTKLSSNPVGSRLNVKSKVAETSSITVVPLRSWKYAFLIVASCWHDHLCARLQKQIQYKQGDWTDLFDQNFAINYANTFFFILCFTWPLIYFLDHMNNSCGGLEPSYVSLNLSISILVGPGPR